MATKPSKAVRAKRDRDLARLELETVAIKKKTEYLQNYDVLNPNRLRKAATAERKSENETYDMSRRLKGAALGRDLERNYSPAKSIIHQIKVNVVGSMGKLRINKGDKDKEKNTDAQTATDWFNQVWSKDCDYRDDCDWSTTLGNYLAAVLREGDIAHLVDDGVTQNDSGQLLAWEADQCVPYATGTWPSVEYAGKEKGDIQDSGLIRDSFGRIKGFVVTGKRGETALSNVEDGTIYSRGIMRLTKNPWRVNQGRGVPSLITSAANFIDVYDILAAELQTAKRAAKQYGYVKRSEAVMDFDNPLLKTGYLPENDGQAQATADTQNANLAAATGARNYEQFEQFAGGLVDYLDKDDEVTFPDINRPNANLVAFMDAVNGMSGAAMGLARVYTTLQATSSYTAFRGEMIMTWITFRWLQKWLERNVCDWTAVRVLRWAMRKGEVPKLSAGWERRISWGWPKMPEVKEIDAQKAIAEALKNGTTDYSELLGPEWRKRLECFADMVDVIRDLNLPLSILETKSGGVTGPEPEAPEPEPDEDSNTGETDDESN